VLTQTYEKLERDVDIAHDAALRASMNILNRLKPKWRNQKKYKKKGPKLPKTLTAEQKAILQKREYFYMSAQAILAQHKEIKDAVSADVLFEKAIKAEVPFELFHDWIKANVSKVSEEKKRSSISSPKSPTSSSGFASK